MFMVHGQTDKQTDRTDWSLNAQLMWGNDWTLLLR